MGKLAFLFAGQGAQYTGMGHSLYLRGGAAARVFEAAEKIRPGTMRDCFEGTAERQAQTEVTQPCVFTTALAAAEALAEAGARPHGAAGFSLGEPAALTFSGAFAAGQGLRLVCRRGEVMAQAAAGAPGAMAAVLKLEDSEVEALCARFGNVWPVNYNCPGQLVAAGDAAALPLFCEAVKRAGGLAKPLAVSGAFHSPWMRPAAEAFADILAGEEMAAPAIPVYANRTAAPYPGPDKALLAQQICSPVRWADTLRRMAADGYDTFVEVGPSRTLAGLVKRNLPGAACRSVQDADSLAQALEMLATAKV